MIIAVSAEEDKYEHLEVDGVIDSRAYETICPMEVLHSSGEIRNSMGWASYSSFLRKRKKL